MRIQKAAVAACFCVGLSHAVAATVDTSVQTVRVGGDGRVGLTTTEAMANPANCTSTAYYDLQLDAGTKFKLVILLAAQSSGRLVRLEINDTGCGTTGLPIVDFVTFLP